jgi:hypothetical protein
MDVEGLSEELRQKLNQKTEGKGYKFYKMSTHVSPSLLKDAYIYMDNFGINEESQLVRLAVTKLVRNKG